MTKRFFIVFFGGVFTILLIGTVGLIMWASGPAISTPRAVDVDERKTTATEQTLHIETPQYSTRVTGGYGIRTRHDDQVGVILADMVANESQKQGGQLAITIAKMPEGGLRAVSDVILRQNATDRYKEIVLDGTPEGSIVYRSDESYELTIFFPHNDRYAAVSLTYAKTQQERYEAQLKELLQYWVWL